MYLIQKEARKLAKRKQVAFKHGDIQVYRSHGRVVWIDNRTEYKLHPEPSIVYPFLLDDHRVYIICPYCGEIHIHGNAKGRYEGYRVSHCHAFADHADYYIKAL